MRTTARTCAVVIFAVAAGAFVLASGRAMAVAQDRAKAGASDVEFDALRPGLIANYSSAADPQATVARLDSKPAFSLGRSSPHPRIPPGPFAVTWTGILHLKDPGPIRFDAYVCGEVTVEIDGVMALQGRGETETDRIGPGQPLNRETGLFRIVVRYRSLPDRRHWPTNGQRAERQSPVPREQATPRL